MLHHIIGRGLARTLACRIQHFNLAGLALVTALAGVVVLAPPAAAATPTNVSVSSGVLRVTSPTGVASDLTVKWGDPWHFVVEVRDSTGILAATSPCTTKDIHTVRCTSVKSFDVSTSDRNDTIRNQTSLGGSIDAGDGDDRVEDGAGSQVIVLGAGDDWNVQGEGADQVFAYTGTDTVSYAARTSGVYVSLDDYSGDGQKGEGDNIHNSVEWVAGGSGNDILTGSAANNRLVGNDGNDKLSGMDGNDTLVGMDGDDSMDGGDDSMDAGDGNDRLDGGPGADSMYGGGDTDTVTYAGRSVAVTVSIDYVADDGGAGEQDKVWPSVENIVGGSGDDTLRGDHLANRIDGGAGNDHVFGMSGQDELHGGSGNDVLKGYGDEDRLYGDSGEDTGSGGTEVDVCDTEYTDDTCP